MSCIPCLGVLGARVDSWRQTERCALPRYSVQLFNIVAAPSPSLLPLHHSWSRNVAFTEWASIVVANPLAYPSSPSQGPATVRPSVLTSLAGASNECSLPFEVYTGPWRILPCNRTGNRDPVTPAHGASVQTSASPVHLSPHPGYCIPNTFTTRPSTHPSWYWLAQSPQPHSHPHSPTSPASSIHTTTWSSPPSSPSSPSPSSQSFGRFAHPGPSRLRQLPCPWRWIWLLCGCGICWRCSRWARSSKVSWTDMFSSNLPYFPSQFAKNRNCLSIWKPNN